MKWARIRVSDCLTQALIDAGLKIEDAGTNDGVVTSICQVMAKKIKNIIVLPNTKNGYLFLKLYVNAPPVFFSPSMALLQLGMFPVSMIRV